MVAMSNIGPPAVNHSTRHIFFAIERALVVAFNSLGLLLSPDSVRAFVSKVDWRAICIVLTLTFSLSHAQATRVVSVYGGARTCMALLSDGTVWQWGYNIWGELGDGTMTERHTPVQVHGPNDIGFLNSITAIMGGEPYNFALKSDGTVWSWGWNSFGSLGDGSNTDSHVPVQVHGPNNNNFLNSIVALGGRGYHSLALESDGTVWAWGFNTHGQLGDGSTTHRNLPVQVGNLSSVAAVTGGYSFSMALKTDRTLWTWGGNSNGELGNGTNTSSYVPVQVTGLSDVIQASSGWKHAVALKSDGTVWTWGQNSKGELGDAGTANRNLPYQVTSLSHVIAVSGGDCHTIALKADGTVWTWGCYGRTQVDANTIVDYVHPVPIQVPGLTHVVKLAARDYHNVAVKSDGTVWTWGWNVNGQLGNGTTIDSENPVQVTFPVALTGSAMNLTPILMLLLD
jgi:alpha-tubulin suppressor-like RCC1 family protein